MRPVFARGDGQGPWLSGLSARRLRWVVRWKQGTPLLEACGQERQAWEMARGKRPWAEARRRWDTPCRLWRRTRVVAWPLSHRPSEGQ